MALNVKDITKIIEVTPASQAVLLKGIHGIGKSEIITSTFTRKGYRVVTKFLGQMVDSGDLIGLPDKQKIDGIIKMTFAPPDWWPTDMKEMVILFLDEINRAKPELKNCIMDMVLNRKLNGRSLPDNCRIIGAMNPLTDDSYYDVEELDPALQSRFNIYDFLPDHDEWLDWAVSHKIHHDVIGFITKNPDQLDPETKLSEGAKIEDVQPDRRSWERLSDVLKNYESKEYQKFYDENLFTNHAIGMIGTNCSARFIRFRRENHKGINPGSVISGWNKNIKKQIKETEPQNILDLNRQITMWFDMHVDEFKASSDVANKYTHNLSQYLDAIGDEKMVHFLDLMLNEKEAGKNWCDIIIRTNTSLSDKFFKAYNQEDEFDEEEYTID